MDHMEEFPFSPGQKVESKSNIKGFRGAWFRSEIKAIQIRRGEIWCAMQYVDFPDEKTNFMKAYQQDSSGKKKRVLMVRPAFPLLSMGVVDESMIKEAAEPVVVVNGDWWVGDLVDWFADGCFWTAKIAAVINKEVVQVELPGAPLGEGGTYEAAVKDIRPSLDWSIDRLWTLPNVKTLAAFTIDIPSPSLSSPATNVEKEHIFIAKQEPRKVPVVRDLQDTLFGHDVAQLKRKSFVLSSGIELGKVSNVYCTSSSLISSQYAHTITSGIPEQCSEFAVRDSNEETLKTQKSFDFNCARIISSGDQRTAPLDSHSKGLIIVNKPVYSDQIQSYRTGEQASSSQTQEQAKVHIRAIDDAQELSNSLPQSEAIDLNSKAGPDQKASSKSDVGNATSDIVETHLLEEFNTLLGDEKLLDISDEKVASSIVALEELISRVVWLKGVMELGLKGWYKERRNRKWVFSEREGQPIAKSENMESGSGLGFCPP